MKITVEYTDSLGKASCVNALTFTCPDEMDVSGMMSVWCRMLEALGFHQDCVRPYLEPHAYAAEDGGGGLHCDNPATNDKR